MNKHIEKVKNFINQAYSNNKYVQDLLNQLPSVYDCDIHADKTEINLKYAIRELNKMF